MHEAEAVESAPEGGVEQDFLPHGSPAQARLEDQIAWYDAKSRHNQRWFKLLKVWQIVVAAAIPVAAAAEAPVWLMGGGGALIVVLEGFQQLQQYQQNWTTARPASGSSMRSTSSPRARDPTPPWLARMRCWPSAWMVSCRRNTPRGSRIATKGRSG